MTAEQQKKFKYWQWRTIIGTMVGYIFFYLIRKNFSFAMPGLTAEYGISKAALGGILSAAGFLYGLSKLFNGMLADRINGRWHMVTGLAVSTLSALIIGCGVTATKRMCMVIGYHFFSPKIDISPNIIPLLSHFVYNSHKFCKNILRERTAVLPPQKALFFEYFLDIFSRIGRRMLGNLLGRSLGNDSTAAVSSLGSQVYNMVGALDNVKIMLDDKDGVARIAKHL